jgi:glyoxylase-like metal-dependent hydrolase (beta-lactamase superfamily II)
MNLWIGIEHMKNIELHLGHAGYCEAKEHHAIRDGKRQTIKFHALWGLIRHPEEGYILFDTGYTQRFFEETRNFPSKIYALLTKVSVTPEEEVIHQLKNSGIMPEEIKKIFISHFHADHVGGLRDFPKAKIITSRNALNHTLGLNSYSSFSKGVLKGLLPEDLEQRTLFIENCTANMDPVFGETYDLLGDSSMLAFSLPGHARGQFGLLLQTPKSKYFLVADAAWVNRAVTDMVLPSPVVRLFFDSWKAYTSTLRKLHEFHQLFPDVLIIPTHCEATTTPLISKRVRFDLL